MAFQHPFKEIHIMPLLYFSFKEDAIKIPHWLKISFHVGLLNKHVNEI